MIKPSPQTPAIAGWPRRLLQLYSEAAQGSGWRFFWCKAVIACGLLSGFLLSPRLWLSSRNYPLCPVSDLLPAVPSPLDVLWFGTLIALLAGIALTPRSRRLILAFVCLTGLLSLFDQSRWQPWFYMYLFMLAGLAASDVENGGLNVCRWIMAATYVWSGLQKCNASFVMDVHPFLIGKFVADPTGPFATATAWMAPLVEISIGLALLAPAARRAAVVTVLAMHLALLLILLGNNWNHVVWPWNLAMMALAVILFWRTPDVTLGDIVWPRGSPSARAFRWVVLLLFGVMPALNFADLWDSYLSAALYSGNEVKAYLFVSRSVRDQLPTAAARYCQEHDEQIELNLFDWSLAELNVPPYPARRVYRHIAQRVAKMADNGEPEPGERRYVVLVIRARPPLSSNIRPLERAEYFYAKPDE